MFLNRGGEGILNCLPRAERDPVAVVPSVPPAAALGASHRVGVGVEARGGDNGKTQFGASLCGARHLLHCPLNDTRKAFKPDFHMAVLNCYFFSDPR